MAPNIHPGPIEGRRAFRLPAIVAWALWAASVVGLVVSLITARSGGPDDPGSAILQGGAALMLATVGAILVSRLPHHPIGWLFAVGGFMIAIAGSTSGVADYGLNLHPGSVPGAIWLAWLGQWIWAPELACLFILLPLFYPTGRLPSPRWRAVVIIAIALVVLGSVTSALSPWSPDPYPVGNPLALVGSAGDLVAAMGIIFGTGLLVVGGALAVASLILRYRRAAATERQQIKWFAAVATVTLVGGIVSIAVNIASAGAAATGALGIVATVAEFAIYGGLALLPVALGIAILRYRLYEIDRLISRTLVYGALGALLGAAYVGSVLLLSTVLAPITSGNSLAMAGSTLLVAALFQPVRRRIQSRVDRRFFRSRYDATRELAAFGARLRDQVDLAQLSTEIAGTVERTLQPVSVSLWLRERGS